jgi:hypothetical protein
MATNGKRPLSVKWNGKKWEVISGNGVRRFASTDKTDAIYEARRLAKELKIKLVIYGREGQIFHSAPGKGKLTKAQIEAALDAMIAQTRAAHTTANS